MSEVCEGENVFSERWELCGVKGEGPHYSGHNMPYSMRAVCRPQQSLHRQSKWCNAERATTHPTIIDHREEKHHRKHQKCPYWSNAA